MRKKCENEMALPMVQRDSIRKMRKRTPPDGACVTLFVRWLCSAKVPAPKATGDTGLKKEIKNERNNGRRTFPESRRDFRPWRQSLQRLESNRSQSERDRCENCQNELVASGRFADPGAKNAKTNWSWAGKEQNENKKCENEIRRTVRAPARTAPGTGRSKSGVAARARSHGGRFRRSTRYNTMCIFLNCFPFASLASSRDWSTRLQAAEG
jgi:hypothetical protein